MFAELKKQHRRAPGGPTWREDGASQRYLLSIGWSACSSRFSTHHLAERANWGTGRQLWCWRRIFGVRDQKSPRKPLALAMG
jgi:hypothetical protein